MLNVSKFIYKLLHEEDEDLNDTDIYILFLTSHNNNSNNICKHLFKERNIFLITLNFFKMECNIGPDLMKDDENDLFYFESEHLALKGNKDYCEVLKTVVILSAIREKAIKVIFVFISKYKFVKYYVLILS